MIQFAILNYLKRKGIDRFNITEVVWPYSEWADYKVLDKGCIAVVSYFEILGAIPLLTDVGTKGIITLESYDERIDYAKCSSIEDFGLLQKASSNFFTFHQNKMEIERAVPFLFSTVNAGFIRYFFIKPE